MTPEPDGGMYGGEGVKAFVREYGKPTGEDTLYFIGTHRAECRNAKTCLTLVVRGFNPSRKIIEDVRGAVELLTDKGRCAAAWSFAGLMIAWNKKHAQAAYVSYEVKARRKRLRPTATSALHYWEKVRISTAIWGHCVQDG